MRSRLHLVARLTAIPLAGVATGLATVGIAEQGVARRTLPGVLLLLVAFALGLAPLRLSVPAAVTAACLDGAIVDYLGTPASYWKETLLAGLVVRSLLHRRLRRWEAATGTAMVAVYLGYMVAGTSPSAAYWGARFLLFSAIAGWAVARRPASPTVWEAVFRALAFGVAAGLVLAVWQRTEGVPGLLALGLAYGSRVRQTPGGELRSFGGLSGSATFACLMALATLAWIGVAASGRRRLALETAWMPVAAVAGIALAVSRLGLIAVAAAAVVVGLREIRRRTALGLLAAAPVALALGLAFATSSTEFVLNGFTFGSASAKTRRAFWDEYRHRLSIFGEGPGSAGEAYRRTAPRADRVPLFFDSWQPLERRPGQPPFRWMGTRSRLVIAVRGRRRPVRLTSLVQSLLADRTLSISRGSRSTLTVAVPAARAVPLSLTVPAGGGSVVLDLAAAPPAQPASTVTPGDRRPLALRFSGLDAIFLPAPDPPALQVYRVVRARLGARGVAGTAPGIVDNVYLSWLFEYGIELGAALCTLFVALLLWPMGTRAVPRPLLLTARLWGVFLIVAGLAQDVWEKAPVDLVAALVFGLAFSFRRRGAAVREP